MERGAAATAALTAVLELQREIAEARRARPRASDGAGCRGDPAPHTPGRSRACSRDAPTGGGRVAATGHAAPRASSGERGAGAAHASDHHRRPEVDLGELGVGDIDLGKLGVADRRGREADENDEVGPTS
jgi:cell division transport system ATP-binding protein